MSFTEDYEDQAIKAADAAEKLANAGSQTDYLQAQALAAVASAKASIVIAHELNLIRTQLASGD